MGKTTVQEIDAIFDPSQATLPESAHCDVKAKVETLYADLGISCAMVGAWKDQDGCAECTGSADDEYKAIHQGSTAYACAGAVDVDEHAGHDHDEDDHDDHEPTAPETTNSAWRTLGSTSLAAICSLLMLLSR